MQSKQNRRNFIKSCAIIGGACYTLSIWNEKLFAIGNIDDDKNKDIIDLKKLSYCGIACETQCELYKATKENDIQLKKEIYDKWGWKEKFGIEWDPEKVFCYGCKPADKPLKIGMAECTVRNCALENKMESCVQCKHLSACEKDFWKRWPEFHKNLSQLQEKYSNQPGAVLLDIKQ
jgi:uncharacterized protein YuzB (UPF0349 family)